MQKKISIAIGKFLTSFVVFHYLVIYFVKSIRLEPDDSPFTTAFREPYITSYIDKINDQNFLLIIFEGFFDTWGRNFTGENINSLIQDALVNTLTTFLISSAIAILLSYAIIEMLMKRYGDLKKLSLLQGNWLTLVIFVVVHIFLLLNGLTQYFVLFEEEYLFSFTFYLSIGTISIAGISKILSEAYLIPLKDVELLEDTSFPSKENTMEKNITENVKLSSFAILILSLKSSIIPLLEYIILNEVIWNIEGIGLLIWRAIFNINIPVMVAVLSNLIVICIICKLILDILLAILDIDEEKTNTESQFSLKDQRQTSLKEKVFGSITFIFLVLSTIMAITWLFTGFSFGTDGLLKDPNFVNINRTNLDPFSEGYLLGTDYLGRDVFTLIIVGFSSFFLPMIISLIFRSIIIFGISKIPDFGGSSTSFHIFDIMETIPKLPFVLVIATILSGNIDPILYNLVIPFWLSILFWGWSGKNYLRSSASRTLSKLDKLMVLASLSILSIIIEYSFITYLNIGIVNYSWGAGFNSAINNYPTMFFGVFLSYLIIPFVFLVSTTIYLTGYIRKRS